MGLSGGGWRCVPVADIGEVEAAVVMDQASVIAEAEPKGSLPTSRHARARVCGIFLTKLP